MRPAGLLVMAYGTPASPDAVADYYTHIRHGRQPTDDQLADLVRRYDAIGGISPLATRTEAQRRALADALERRRPATFAVELGQKHAAPFVEDGMAALADAGASTVIGLVLAPHFSRGSIGEYHERAATAAAAHDISYRGIDSWHLVPAYLDFMAHAVRDARTELPEKHKVLFTAHSLPERVLDGDPYPDQLRQSAEAIAERVGLLPWPDWALAWQSAGRTPEPWRGPDILHVIRDLAATGRSAGILVVPQGFTSDHLEVLYDLDIEAASVAHEHGLAFARTRSLNDDATVMDALAGVVNAVLVGEPERRAPHA